MYRGSSVPRLARDLQERGRLQASLTSPVIGVNARNNWLWNDLPSQCAYLS